MRKTYLYGAMALGLLFTACKSDDLTIPEPSQVAEADQTFYVALRISGDIPTGTRSSATVGEDGKPIDSEDFDPGANESEVNNTYFVFYDNSGNVVGNIVPVTLGSPVMDVDNEDIYADGGPTVEKYYKEVVGVSIRKGENLPTQVICYINPISPSSLQNPLNVIQTRTRDVVYTQGGGTGSAATKYFAMSNSVYYPTQNETASGEPQIAAQIPDELLKKSETEAETALKAGQMVNIYVERYATKLSFTAEEAEQTPYKTGTRIYDATGAYDDKQVITLTFEPEYWALNAESTTTYVIKSFREESNLGQILANNYAYNDLNSIINKTIGTTSSNWEWNKPSYHRSYWGMSPAYFTAEYPEVSEDASKLTLNQKYLKYSELATSKNAFKYDATTKTTAAQYFKETTVGSKALASNNPAAAMPSVIFVGKYKMLLGTEEITVPPTKGFYTYLRGTVNDVSVKEDRPFIYFDTKETNSYESCVTGTTSMLVRFLAQSTILFKDENSENTNAPSFTRLTVGNSTDLINMASWLEVTKITDEVKKYVGDADNLLKLQANARSLQFKSSAIGNNIFIASGDGYKQIVADGSLTEEDDPDGNKETQADDNGIGKIEISKANAILMQQVGYAYYYLNSEGYFNIPVKHLGWYRAANNQKNSATIDWTKVRVGDFGMVRNHSYSISINKITGLASGIGDNNDPIVPPAATDDYFVGYSVRILKWAVVPTQSVNL